MPGPANARSDDTVAALPLEIQEAAADWLIRCRAQPTDAALAAALAQWCAEDPAHARAFARVERAWEIVGEIGATERPADIVKLPKRHRHSGRIWGLAGIAAAAAAILIVILPAVSLRLGADHLTGTAASKTVYLTDGSTVTLAADSAIRIEMSPEARQVELLRGEAYFDVARDATRPFRVAAAGMEVEVLGTAFDVDLGDGSTRVAVERGRVAVRAHGAELRLAAGEGITIDDGRLVPTRQPAAQVAAWRQGQLVVEDVSVAEVVARLARYHDGIILLPDADFAARRVTGVFDLGDPAKALRGLADAQGGQLITLSPYFAVLIAGS